MPMHRKIGQKFGDLPFAQLARVTLPMEKNEPADPVQIRLFRAQAIPACPHKGAHLVEQFRLAWKAGLALHHIRWRSTSKIDMNEKYNPELGEQLFVTFYERSSTSR